MLPVNGFNMDKSKTLYTNSDEGLTIQEGHDDPGVAHLSLLTKHNQFPTSCEIYVLPNNKILNSSV